MIRKLTLAFRYTDRGEACALDARRGVVEVHHQMPPKCDAVLALAAQTLHAYGRRFARRLARRLLSGEVRLEPGTPAVPQAFFVCFDTAGAELPKLTLRQAG